VKRLEKNLDELKDTSDHTRHERLVKQADKAMDKLNDELNHYGVYSPKYIGALVENLNIHMNALRTSLGADRESYVAQAFSTSDRLLVKLNASYERARP
jgi:hypothetical protein